MALPKFRFIIGGNSKDGNGSVTIVDRNTGEKIALLEVPGGFDQIGDNDNRYGVTVDFNDDYIVVGQPLFFDKSDRAGTGHTYFPGAVWIYEIGTFELVARREMTDAHLAEYPNDPSLSGNYSPNARFGHAVSVDGDVLVVGAPGSGVGYEGTRPAGRVYQYSLANIAANPNDKQSYQYTYKADSGSSIGHNVFVAGNTIATTEQDSTIDYGLRVKLFDSGLDNIRICDRPAGAPASNMLFGGGSQTNTGDGLFRGLAMSSSNVYVGAPRLFVTNSSGAVYVFDKSNGNHLDDISPILPSDDSGGWNYFGVAVVYDRAADKLIVGSPFKGYDSDYGAVYIYDSDGSNEVIINGEAGAAYNHNKNFNQFGYTPGIASTYSQVVVGNNNLGLSFYNYSGSLLSTVDSIAGINGTINNSLGYSFPSISLAEVQDYVSGTNPIKLSEYYDPEDTIIDSVDWPSIVLEEKPKNPSNTSNDQFGYAVDISGNTVVVGAPNDDTLISNAGSVYVYTYPRDSIALPTPTSGSVSISSFYNFIAADSEGAPLIWQAQRLPLDSIGFFPGLTSGSALGKSVVIDGDRVAAGARTAFDGQVHVWEKSGTTWSLKANIQPSDLNTSTNPQFGTSLALDSDTLVIGAPGDSAAVANSGSVYVFTKSGSGWTQQAKLNAGDDSGGLNQGWQFGTDVSISKDTILVGAPNYKDNYSGSAYFFTRSGSTWTQQAQVIGSNVKVSDRFGSNVSISGDTALVGAYGYDSGATQNGAVFVYTRSGSTWTEQLKFSSDSVSTNQFFGKDVVFDSDTNTAVVGAWYETDNSLAQAGAAYIFTRSGSTWTQQVRLPNYTRPSDEAGSYFGWSLGLSGKRVVVGAYLDDSTGTDIGSAFIFGVPDA